MTPGRKTCPGCFAIEGNHYWNNAPAADTNLLASLGAVSVNTWYDVDVTSLVTGDGTYSLLVSDSNGGADYSSKEGANAPQLVLTLGGTPAPTATATPPQTPTPGPSPTPTNTPTATATAPAAFNSATFIYDGDGRRVKSTINGVTTTFVGAHYEVTNGVVTKYYYAGSQRIAMRTNGTLNYLLGDHLGSTSLTTNASGQTVSQLRYQAWGEERYASGTTPTDYTYTGQYSYTADFGLMFYNARWYDPALGRFAQADSIVPPGVQGYDRYAYANNNPVRYTDPSGHCPVCIGAIAAFAVGYNTSLHFFGILPDYRGIHYAEAYVTNKDAIVGAGLAVQSEWYVSVWDDPSNPLSSSYGPAQITQAEIDAYGLEGQNLHDPDVAVQAMTHRIDDVVSQCSECLGRDKLILAALAQNGSEYALGALKDVSSLERLEDGGLNWGRYFNSLNPKGNNLQDLRSMGHHNFDSRFMLHLFMNNLSALGERGWKLPELSSEDRKYINRLRWGTGNTPE